MTATQFFIILGTMYLIPGMSANYRQWAGFSFIGLALLIEIFK
jgi:hypothetical protein